MNSIERYLASEAAQGLFVDEGGFQLDPEEAIKKLSLFALPSPGMWVLKMLQAAVVVGAHEIHFTFDRRLVRVRFENLGGWKSGQILSQMLSGKEPSQPEWRHLISGILGAAVGFSETLSWTCGGECVRASKSGTQVQAVDTTEYFELVATRPSVSALSSHLFTSPLRYLFRQTVDEYKALVDFAQVTPIKVVMDKYRLEGSYQVSSRDLPPVADFDSDKNQGRGVMLAQFPVANLGREKLPYPVDHVLPTSYESHSNEEKLTTLRLGLEPKHEAEAVVCVYWCLQRRTRVTLVMDGVVLERRNLLDDSAMEPFRGLLEGITSEFALDIYLAASWSDLDLSQFRSREDGFHRALIGCLPELRRVLIHIRSQSEKDWDFSTTPVAKNTLPSLSIGSILGGAFLSLFIPHMVVFGGAIGGFLLVKKGLSATGFRSKWVESFQAKLRMHGVVEFQKALDRLLEGLEGMEEKLQRNFKDDAAP